MSSYVSNVVKLRRLLSNALETDSTCKTQITCCFFVVVCGTLWMSCGTLISGASRHMDISQFWNQHAHVSTFNRSGKWRVDISGSSWRTMQVTLVSKIATHVGYYNGTLYVPGLTMGLISVGRLTNNGLNSGIPEIFKTRQLKCQLVYWTYFEYHTVSRTRVKQSRPHCLREPPMCHLWFVPEVGYHTGERNFMSLLV
jgi:hypothetical protein